MQAEDWLKAMEKQLVIAQCNDREKVLYSSRQLRGTAQDWGLILLCSSEPTHYYLGTIQDYFQGSPCPCRFSQAEEEGVSIFEVGLHGCL